jgi:hypothetical protein
MKLSKTSHYSNIYIMTCDPEHTAIINNVINKNIKKNLWIESNNYELTFYYIRLNIFNAVHEYFDEYFNEKQK